MGRLVLALVIVDGPGRTTRGVSGHVALEDHILGVVAATGIGLCVIVVICVWGKLRNGGVDRYVGVLLDFLLDSVGITNATDNLLIFILKLLDALLELVELLGEVNAFAGTTHRHYFTCFLPSALLGLHQLLS